jgi:hypothetical protein
MQENDGDSDSEHFLPGDAHEGGFRGPHPVNNNAAAHELDQMRTEALRDIDKGGFSCVASSSAVFRPLTLL